MSARVLVLAVLLVAMSGCAGVPMSVVWSTSGAVAGAAGAAFTLDDDLFRYFVAPE